VACHAMTWWSGTSSSICRMVTAEPVVVAVWSQHPAGPYDRYKLMGVRTHVYQLERRCRLGHLFSQHTASAGATRTPVMAGTGSNWWGESDSSASAGSQLYP
jgi:hypothetical protein